MSKLFGEIVQGTAEARDYMKGERKDFKVTLPESIDVQDLHRQWQEAVADDSEGLDPDQVFDSLERKYDGLTKSTGQ